MFAVLGTLVPIFGVMFLGGIAERWQILPFGTARSLNAFVYYFSMPLLIFSCMAELRIEDVPPMAILGYLIGLVVAQLLAHVFLRFSGESSVRACMGSLVAAFPNNAYMGMPIIMLLFPNSSTAVMYVTLTIILHTINLVYTDTFLSIAKNPALGMQSATRTILKSLLHNQLLICSLAGAAVGFSGMYFPAALLQITKMVGSTAGPCALFCMGMSLTAKILESLCYIYEKKQSHTTEEQIKTEYSTQWSLGKQFYFCVYKLFIMPIIVGLCCFLLGVRGLPFVIMTLISAMPTGVTAVVLAEKHEVLVVDSNIAVIISTLVSIGSLSCILILLQFFEI